LEARLAKVKENTNAALTKNVNAAQRKNVNAAAVNLGELFNKT